MKFRKSNFLEYFPEKWQEPAKEFADLTQVWVIDTRNDRINASLSISKNVIISIEIFQTRHFILKSKCSCPDFKEDQGCVHIFALLFRVLYKGDNLISNNTTSRYSFEQLLQMITGEELEDFIRFVVPAQPQLQRQFRQFFEYKLVSEDHLLDSYINKYFKDIIKIDGTINKRAVADLEFIFNTHLYRAERLLRDDEYTESMQVMSTLVINALDIEERLSFGIFKNDFYYRAHQLLNSYENVRLAPEFFLKLEQFYRKEVEYPIYQYFDKNNAIDYLLKKSQNLDSAELRDIFISKLTHVKIGNKGPWIYYSLLLNLQEKDAELEKVVNSLCILPENLISLLTFLRLKKNNKKELEFTIGYYIDFCLQFELSVDLIDAISHYYIQVRDVDSYASFIMQVINKQSCPENILLQTINFESIIKIDGWVDKVLSHFSELIQIKLEGIYLKMIVSASRYEFLWDFIWRTCNLYALIRYYNLLVKNSVDMEDDQIKVIVGQYLDNYIGNIAGDTIENLLKEMLFAGMPAKIKSIKGLIEEKYPDRKTLIRRIQSY